MKRPHSVDFLRQRPIEIEEQQFNPLQTVGQKGGRFVFHKPTLKTPKINELISQIDSLMCKFTKPKGNGQGVRTPLVDLNLYTLADVNIPTENPTVQSRVYMPKRLDRNLETNFQSTNASSKKESSVKHRESCELNVKKQKKLARIEQLMVENAKCLNEKLVQSISKQEKEFKPDREYFIKNLMSFSSFLYSAIKNENNEEITQLALQMSNQQKVLKELANTNNNLNFLLGGACFFVDEKARILGKNKKNLVMNKIKTYAPTTVFK